MPGVALALLALYGLLGFGLRIAVHRRRTGSTGFKALRGPPVEWAGAVLFAGGIALSAAGPVLQLLDAVTPIEPLDGDVGHLAGAAAAAAGILLTLVAQFAMGDAWRIGVDPGERTELVTGGVFAVVRNPIFAAMICAFSGLALLSPNPVTLAGTILLVAAIELQTRAIEEPYLARTHGQRYADYAARVGRFLPRIGRP